MRVKSRRMPSEPGAAGRRLGLDRKILLGDRGTLEAVDACILDPIREASAMLELGKLSAGSCGPYNGLKFPDAVRSKMLLELGALSSSHLSYNGLKFPDAVRSKKGEAHSASCSVAARCRAPASAAGAATSAAGPRR